MNPAVFQSKESGLTGILRKVYENVPIAESWDAARVLGELRRTGHRPTSIR